MTTALIDADLVAYRVSATVQEQEHFELCQQRIDVLMQNILDGVNAKTYRAFLTGKDNFRKKVNPEYKANRKEMPVDLQSVHAAPLPGPGAGRNF